MRPFKLRMRALEIIIANYGRNSSALSPATPDIDDETLELMHHNALLVVSTEYL